MALDIKADLLKQIRKNREGMIEVEDKRNGDFKLFFRRPTDFEAVAMAGKSSTQFDICKTYVSGWEGVKACHIVKSAGDEALEFDPELWAEWLADRPDFWAKISDKVLESYKVHVTQMAEARKN